MKMNIDIRVSVPEADAEKRLEFIEGVMELFRATFPNADPLPHLDINTPPPVTLWFPAEEEG